MSMYSRKWTRMDWWYSMKMFRKLDMIPHTKTFEILTRIQPSETIFTNTKSKNAKDSNKFILPKLINKVLDKYPELRFVPGPKISLTPDELPPSSHIILDFVTKQQDLMKKGFTEQKAFELVEKTYQARMQRKRDDFLLTQGVAVNNRARSLMNFYQQQSEYEGRLKVLRLERDLLKYEEAVKNFHKRVMEQSLAETPETNKQDTILSEEDKEVLTEIKIEKIPKPQAKYTKVLEKMVYKGYYNKDAVKIELKPDEVVKNFLDGSRNILSLYLELTNIKDKLSGLKDEEISGMLRDSPKKFKARSKLLRKKLGKYNVKLDAMGNLNFSQCTAPPHLIKKLQKDPMTKMALLSEEMSFEFEHHERKKEMAMELKSRLKALEKENNERKPELTKKIEIMKPELETRNFDTYEPLYEKIHEVKIEKEEKMSKELLMSKYERMNFYKREASYRLFETPEEKLYRLEKKWIEQKLIELELESENVNNSEQQDQYRQKLSKLLDDFRSLKYMMEKEATVKSGKLLFSELESLEIHYKDPKVFYEEIQAYLTKVVDSSFQSKKDVIDRSRVQKMLIPRDWEEDTIKGFDFSEEYKKLLLKRDTKAVYEEKQVDLKKKAQELEEASIEQGIVAQIDSDEEELPEDYYDLDPMKLTSGKDGMKVEEQSEEEDSDEQDFDKKKKKKKLRIKKKKVVDEDNSDDDDDKKLGKEDEEDDEDDEEDEESTEKRGVLKFSQKELEKEVEIADELEVSELGLLDYIMTEKNRIIAERKEKKEKGQKNTKTENKEKK